jgi:hypothetical protein
MRFLALLSPVGRFSQARDDRLNDFGELHEVRQYSVGIMPITGIQRTRLTDGLAISFAVRPPFLITYG